MSNLEKLKTLTDSLIEVERKWKSESLELQKILEFSTDGFFSYSPISGEFYLSNKGKIKIGLEKKELMICDFINTLMSKNVEQIKMEIHEVLVLNKNSFRLVVQTKRGKSILVSLVVTQRNQIKKPIRLGGTITILEDGEVLDNF